MTTRRRKPKSRFAVLITQRRQLLELTQGEVGARVGLTQKAVSTWEVGTSLPGASAVLPLAELLGLEAGELLRAMHETEDDALAASA